MKPKSRMKLFVLVVISIISIPMTIGGIVGQILIPLSTIIALTVFGVCVFGLIGVPFWISLYSDFERDRKEKLLAKKIETETARERAMILHRELLKVVAEYSKPLSVYDFMVRVAENEDVIESELEYFVTKRLAKRIVNESGLTLYQFDLIPTDSERKDLLD